MTKTLEAATLPSIAELAALIKPAREDLAANLLDASDATVTLLAAGEDATSSGYATETSIELVAYRVEWTWESRTLGPRRQGATVLQVITGGRTGGEGWAEVQQYVSPIALTEDAVRGLAGLIALDGLPRLVAREEL